MTEEIRGYILWRKAGEPWEQVSILLHKFTESQNYWSQKAYLEIIQLFGTVCDGGTPPVWENWTLVQADSQQVGITEVNPVDCGYQ